MTHSVRATLTSPRTAQELTLDAASAARNSRYSSRPLDRSQIKKLLDSRNEREVLEGLRKVISVRHPGPSPQVTCACTADRDHR